MEKNSDLNVSKDFVDLAFDDSEIQAHIALRDRDWETKINFY